MSAPSKASKMRVGLLGCGAVAHRWYLRGLTHGDPRYEVVAVCDVDSERARLAASMFHIPSVASSLSEMIDRDRPDLVVVLTRHNDHAIHIEDCLRRGVHVYSEKPFALTSDAGQRLLSLATSRGLTIGCAPQVMLSTRNQRVKRLLSDGAIGNPTLVRASSSNLGPAGRADTDYDPRWFYEEGGSLQSLGIYGLSLLLWLFGAPQRLSSFGGIAIPQRIVEFGPAEGATFSVTAPDNVVGIFDFGNGVLALFDGSYSVANPPRYELEIHGTTGSLFIGGFGGPDSVVLHARGDSPRPVGPSDDRHLQWNLAWGVEETIAAIQEHREPATSAAFALSVIAVMEQMLDSDRGSREAHG